MGIITKSTSNGGFFVYRINVDRIGPSSVLLDAEFGREYGWIFVLGWFIKFRGNHQKM